jgi:hypothetical protein
MAGGLVNIDGIGTVSVVGSTLADIFAVRDTAVEYP